MRSDSVCNTNIFCKRSFCRFFSGLAAVILGATLSLCCRQAEMRRFWLWGEDGPSVGPSNG